MAKRIVKTKEQYQAAVREMNAGIQRKLQKLMFESVQEFYDFCLNALALSVEKAPVEYGDLRGTAYLQINGQVCAIGTAGSISGGGAPSGLEGLNIHARIVFPMEYALIQHEHWEFAHPLGGQAFYLEIGVTEAAKEFAGKMAQIAFK